MPTIIDTLIERHAKISEFLTEKNEISLKIDSDDEFRKVLILSVASYFENLITDSILSLAENTKSDGVLNFVKNKAVSRQYHTYFEWNGNNANGFLGLFGDSFKNSVLLDINKDINLASGVKAFLKLGYQRNILAHGNFASASLSWSTEEIIEMYRSALNFVLFLSAKIQNCN